MFSRLVATMAAATRLAYLNVLNGRRHVAIATTSRCLSPVATVTTTRSLLASPSRESVVVAFRQTATVAAAMLQTACTALRLTMFFALGLVHIREQLPFAVVDNEPG